MTQIHAPDATGKVWHGIYGNPRILEGDALVVTSDGVRHPV